MSQASKITERLWLEATLYQHMALECWDVELAATFQQSARECIEDATALEERLPMHAR